MVDGRTLFFPVSLIFVNHRSSLGHLVIRHERNLQVRVRRVASFHFRITPSQIDVHDPSTLVPLPRLVTQNLMDIVAEPVYEPTPTNSDEFVIPYDGDPGGSLSPEQPLASRIGKTRVYLYSESDAESRLGKVRLQLRRKFR